VTERVVDKLEPVEIEDEHREPTVVPVQELLEPLEQDVPVGESREAVVARPMGEGLDGPVPVGHVASDDHDVLDLGVWSELGRGARLQPPLFVMDRERVLVGPGLPTVEDRADLALPEGSDLATVRELLDAATDDLVAHEPGLPEHRGVHVDVAQVAVHSRDRVG